MAYFFPTRLRLSVRAELDKGEVRNTKGKGKMEGDEGEKVNT